MKINEENELRSLVADLVMERYTDTARVSLDGASVDDFRNLIRAAHVVSDEAGHSLHRWVDAGRHAGLSWADVGQVLGVSRQAAQQRFSPAAESVGTAKSDLICRTGMNAFNEVAALDEEGRKGNELVGAAAFKLFFARRGVPWDNLRVTALRGTAAIRQFEEEGWTYAATWYPFHYFTRQSQDVDAP